MRYLVFNLFVVVFILLDLFLYRKKTPSYKSALSWSIFWVFVAIGFFFYVQSAYTNEKALEFIAGYTIEKFLSLDNVMVFALIFKQLQIPLEYQHRVLIIGILSALVMRAGMIFLGVELIEQFSWTLIVFGFLLLFTGIKVFFTSDKPKPLKETFLWKYISKIIPSTTKFEGQRFIIKTKQGLKASPLLLALIFIEFSDIIFAVDSIPAIFAVTRDPYIVYTANVLAILGLRALYFLLAKSIEQFKYLKYGLAVVLIIVGCKLIFGLHFPVWLTLTSLFTVFGLSIVFSLRSAKREV